MESLNDKLTNNLNKTFEFLPQSHISWIVYCLCISILLYLIFKFCKITQLYKTLTCNNHDPDNCRCCVQIFNQCNRRNNKAEASVRMAVSSTLDEITETDDEDSIVRQPLRITRSPSVESHSRFKYTYNLNN